jgi:N4-gp56 family major capsid protein
MPYTEILTSHDLTEEQWDRQINSEYLSSLQLKNFMGSTTMAPIQVKMDLSKDAGDAVTIGIRSQLIGGRVDGRNKARGNEGRVDFYAQRITIDNVRHVEKFEDVPMSQKRVGWDLLNNGREALVEKAQIALEEDLINTLCDATVRRVRGRYLYGAADANWNATHTTALQNVDNANDKLTTNVLRFAKRKAQIPVNAYSKIRPMRIVTGQNMEEYFVSLHHPYAIRDLVDGDAAYRNAMLLLPPNSNERSPLFTGSFFKGVYDGVLVYEYDRMPLVSSTIQVTHSILMGAQAAAVCWGQMAKFEEEEEDMGHDVIYGLHEIRGMAKIGWNRNSVDSSIADEDNGLVNIFVAAVAD